MPQVYRLRLRFVEQAADLIGRKRNGQPARHGLDRRKSNQRVEGVVEVSHGHDCGVEASQHNHGAVHRGVAVAADIAQVLNVGEHIARRDLIRRTILESY